MLKKAAIGTGLPVGLAEDASQAGAWLIGQDQDGVGAVPMAIKEGFNNSIANMRDGHTQIFLEARVALCGPSSVDLLAGDTSVDEIRLCNIDSPFLLIGQAGIGSQDFGIELTLRFSDGAAASISEQGLSLCGSPPKEGTDVFMTCCQSNQTTGIANIRTDDIEIDLETWRTIEALAAKTYVPSSDLSRAKGAGAGLIDNN